MDRVLKFGSVRFLEGEEVAIRASMEAHRLYNEKVARRRSQTERFRELRAATIPGMNELEARRDDLKEEMESLKAALQLERKSATAKTRGKRADGTKTVRKIRNVGDEKTARIEVIKKELKAIGPVWKEMCAKYKAMLTPAREAFKERTALLMVGKNASDGGAKRLANEAVWQEMSAEDWPEIWKDEKRSEVEGKISSTDWPMHDVTVKQTLDDADRAAKTSHQYPSFRRFVNANCGKKVGVRTHGEVIGKFQQQMLHNFAILDMREAHPNAKGNRKRKKIATVRMRLFKQKEEPNLVTFTVKIDRPIPEDAQVKYVWLVPKEKSGRVTWSLQFVVGLSRPLKDRAVGKGIAHVRLCWERESGSDVACFAEVNGRKFYTPTVTRKSGQARGIMGGQDHADILQVVGDRLFNEARKHLVARKDSLSDETKEQIKNIHLWKKHNKLVAVLDELSRAAEPNRDEIWRSWRAERLANGPDLHEALGRMTEEDAVRHGASSPWNLWMISFVEKHRHIEAYMKGQRGKVLGWRKDYYRNVACQLAMKYEICELEKVNLQALRRKPRTESEVSYGEKRRQLIQKIAPGTFKECLQQAFGDRFREVEKKEGAKRAA